MRRVINLLAGVCLAGAVFPAAAAAWPTTLPANGTLSANQAIVSSSGQYVFIMQSDGNLVEYIYGGRAIWNSGTAGDGGDHAVMQQNGNLVLYDSHGAALWSSNSHASGCPQLVIQNDGNVVDYAPGAIWATNTVQDILLPGDVLYPNWAIVSAPHEEFRLIMQGDGNLVLYDANGKPLWASGTNGHAGAHAVMQADGNLVVYDTSGHALWASNTAGKSGAHAVMQEDGNFVIYQGTRAIWASNTYNKGTGGTQAPQVPPAASCPPPAPPPPPPPPPAAAPVVSVPVTTVVHPVQPRHLKVKVVLSWTWYFGTTRLERFKIGRHPRRTRLAVDCRGRGCPGKRKAHAAGVRGVRRLLRLLNGRSYRAGDHLFFTISAPGYLPERAEIIFRYGRLPRIRLLRR